MMHTADIVIRSGRVLTIDKAVPTAEAIAIAGNRIIAVGGNRDMEPLIGSYTRVIDAQGATVLPGFNDAHAHIFFGAAGMKRLSLAGIRGFDELKAVVGAYAKANPDIPLIDAHSAGYAVISDNERLSRHHLDRISADRPMLIFSPDQHTAWANTIALLRADILEGRDLGPGSEVVLGEDGLATGELREIDAIKCVTKLSATGGREMLGLDCGYDPDNLTQLERAGDVEVIQQGLSYCASLGITSIQNMDGSLYQLGILDEIERTQGLPVRVRMPFHIRSFMPISVLHEKAAHWRTRFNNDKLRCDFVKLFVDGVTESGTATFRGGYAHDPNLNGRALFTQDELDAVTIAANRLGFPVAAHAIGDGAVCMMLDACQASMVANGKIDCRNRIEHVEVVCPEDVARFAELGVAASMQPSHTPGSTGVPLEPYLTCIGSSRWPYAFAWRKLAKAGATVVFGTDWPVSPLDPIASIFDAMTRKQWSEDTPDQRLSLTETLAAYTRTGAWVEFMEDRKGILKPGYLADVVVLSHDIGNIQPIELKKVHPVATICDGKVTFQRER